MEPSSQNKAACLCTNCGGLFAVKTSFLGSQVKCPICLTTVPAQESSNGGIVDDMVTCRCIMCQNPFAVKLSCLGCQVKCPACSAAITATRDTSGAPDGEEQEEKRTRPPDSELLPAPAKKVDQKAMSGLEAIELLAEKPAATTKIRKRREEQHAAPPIEAAQPVALTEEHPDSHTTRQQSEQSAHRRTWPVWLCLTGLVMSVLGSLMYLRGSDLDSEGAKIINISDKFVDHDSDFSRDMDEEAVKTLQNKADKYQQDIQARARENLQMESLSSDVSAAMNQLALYCMANSDTERLKYVIDPETTRQKMAHWATYGHYRDTLPQEAGTPSKKGDLLQIMVLMDNNITRPAVFLYDRDEKKWKLDWEAWEGYSPMLPSELVVNKPTSPVPVRVIISVSGIYKKPFLEESSNRSYRNSSYIGFMLEFPHGERLHAYVDRYSPLSLELTNLLYNGALPVQLQIHYPDDLPGNQAVIIDRLLHSGWMNKKTRAQLDAAEVKPADE